MPCAVAMLAISLSISRQIKFDSVGDVAKPCAKTSSLFFVRTVASPETSFAANDEKPKGSAVRQSATCWRVIVGKKSFKSRFRI